MATNPTPIVDKNGKATTVHRKIDQKVSTRKVPAPFSKSLDRLYRENAEHPVPEDMKALRAAAATAIGKSQYADLTVGIQSLAIINAVEHNMAKKNRSFAHAYIITRAEKTKNAENGSLDTFLAIEKEIPADTQVSEAAPYIPHDIAEMDRMIAALPAEADTTLPNSHIRLMGILRNDVERRMGSGLDFKTSYEQARNSHFSTWIADYSGAIESFEALAD